MIFNRRAIRVPHISSLRRGFAIAMLLAFAVSIPAQAPADSAIKAMMLKSVDDWNRHDIDAFAKCYKNSPDILFIGRKTSRGYDQMVATYKTAYSTPEKMGTLTFTELETQPLDARFATVTGHFHLERTAAGGGNADGYFLLVVEHISAGWKIVRDDSTSLPPASPAAAAITASANSPAPPKPDCDTPDGHRFDFWLGEWTVTGPQGRHVGDSSIQNLFPGGCVILENWTATTATYTGKSFNTYDKAAHSWTQYWVDSLGYHTQFTNGMWTAPSLVFEGHNPGTNGEPQLQRFTFTRLDANNVRQFQENSNDGGKTWTVGYDLHYTRKPAAN